MFFQLRYPLSQHRLLSRLSLCVPRGTLWSSVLVLLFAARVAAESLPSPAGTTPAPAPGLRVQVWSDEPTGVFWDRETIQTRTALVFSMRISNDRAEERNISLTWRITDAAGKVWVQRKARFPAAAGGVIHRRELFEAPLRGAYRLTVDAWSRRRGPDDYVVTELPFAVVTAPTPGFRPRSFFALTAPALLTGPELDFYARIGARVLRSPWLPSTQEAVPGGTGLESWRSADAATLDAQMRARLGRGLATHAVLPVSGAGWAWQALPLVTRFDAIKLWEVEGETSPEAWAEWATGARAARSDIALLRPLPAITPPSGRSSLSQAATADGMTVPLPTPAAPDGTGLGEPHSAALLRLLRTAKSRADTAGVPAFYSRQDAGNVSGSALNDAPLRAAGKLVARYMMAVISGAAGMSSADLRPLSSLAPANAALPSGNDNARLAQAAAFAEMTRRLEDAAFSGNVFPASPLLWGAVFQAPSSTIGVVWMAGEEQGARLRVRVPTGELMDLFGNSLARAQGGLLTIPLGPQPVYLVSEAPTTVITAALRDGILENVSPLAAQVLPLTQRPKSKPIGAPLLLRVRLQNLSNQTFTGLLQVTPPPPWSVPTNSLPFTLEPGEAQVFPFTVAGFTTKGAPPSLNNAPPLVVTARSGRSRWEWRQGLRLATAVNVGNGQSPRVDGDLSDWQGATWMEVRGPEKAKSPIKGRLALRWSAQRLYLAAQVEEPALRPRRADEPGYRFWHGYDALQLAFGLRDEPSVKPSPSPFQDTDFGFLLCPEDLMNEMRIEGRLLRLWRPSLPFGGQSDARDWGGAVPGAQCAVQRDEQRRLTIYEASLPLIEMAALRPAMRAQRDVPVRFSWILHNDEGPGLEWSRVTGVFPWWEHTGSFLPAHELHLAAQTTLGFTQVSPVENDGPVVLPPVALPPVVKPTATPPAVLPPRRLYWYDGKWHETPQPRKSPTQPPSVPPLSPRTLPPVAPPPGKTLPPSEPPPVQ